ncbi:hypothetical protein DRN74_02255 [Candidatus Micrarchaeota archaeon]|nr:MAG: hypothetical protein DRN74_02255 [Candidatus Micrarchaeota archaeon]
MNNLEEKRKKALQAVREKIKKELIKRDKLIVYVVKAIDELDKSSNLLFEKLRHWYAIYYPELSQKAKDLDAYIETVLEKDRPTTSLGAKLTEEDLNRIKRFASIVKELRDERRVLEQYLEKVMEEEAPNITAVAGAMLGARLISAAGSLKKLAEYPSSTIQVLGAEKALFAHIRKKTKSPKHGYIFAFPELRTAPKKLRGKIARKIASKISMVARIDYFKGEFIGDKLRKELEEEIAKIKGT